MAIQLTVNGAPQDLDLPGEMPLLWALRDGLNLTGTKFGCGVAACGACTVLVDGQAVRSCQTALADVAGAQITTIEGLGTPQALSVLQQAWVDQQVAQCGYCQSGQIMQAARCWPPPPTPPIRRFPTRWTATCAAAAPIRASWPPSGRPAQRWRAKPWDACAPSPAAPS